MDDSIGVIILDVFLHGICYHTGRIALKVLSFGRITIEPKRKLKKRKSIPELTAPYRVSDLWTSAIGLAFWICVAFIIAFII